MGAAHKRARSLEGEELRHARESAGLGQADLARALGVTQQTISDWEFDGAPTARVDDLSTVLETLPKRPRRGRGDVALRLVDVTETPRSSEPPSGDALTGVQGSVDIAEVAAAVLLRGHPSDVEVRLLDNIARTQGVASWVFGEDG